MLIWLFLFLIVYFLNLFLVLDCLPKEADSSLGQMDYLLVYITIRDLAIIIRLLVTGSLYGQVLLVEWIILLLKHIGIWLLGVRIYTALGFTRCLPLLLVLFITWWRLVQNGIDIEPSWILLPRIIIGIKSIVNVIEVTGRTFRYEEWLVNDIILQNHITNWITLSGKPSPYLNLLTEHFQLFLILVYVWIYLARVLM